ncbi:MULTISPECIES: hypothetical protein [unclassified Pseudoxanthomonas]|uniref:hypothetical protein n=1 Tax=unclassified Pseudoxanthomonas TaxID=2645906 RepID=UPI00307F902C
MPAAIPTPDHDDPKELYAFAGLALYAANLLETSLINLAAGLRLAKEPAIIREVFADTFQGLEAKTLGRLLKAARLLIPVAPDLDKLLDDALARRNYLAHAFFREHAAELMHGGGKRHMLSMLIDMIDLFQRADEQVTPLYEQVWLTLGVTPEFVERETAAMVREMDDHYGPDPRRVS